MIPDGLPRILENAAERLIVGLAGQNVAVRLDAHAVERRRAALDTQIVLRRIKLAVLRGCVPDQALAAG